MYSTMVYSIVVHAKSITLLYEASMNETRPLWFELKGSSGQVFGVLDGKGS